MVVTYSHSNHKIASGDIVLRQSFFYGQRYTGVQRRGCCQGYIVACRETIKEVFS